jgi:hypothetical protein
VTGKETINAVTKREIDPKLSHTDHGGIGDSPEVDVPRLEVI